MKIGIIIGIVVLVLIIGGTFYFTSLKSVPNKPGLANNVLEGKNIEIKDFVFNPTELKIKVGDTVTWINKDSAKHTITSNSGGELGSSLLSQGGSYSHTFNNVGEYDYHCSVHSYMKGKIIVE